MTEPIIKVHNLGKRYRIGAKIDPKGRDNFRDAILNTLQAPFKNFKRLRALTNFKDPKLSALCPTQSDDVLWALKDVSFEINKGDVVGIIGRNGSGKSTLLKILSRITEPTEGYVELRGRVASLLEVGTGFHRELTGRENIYLNGSILGMKKREIDKKFDEIVAFSEIEKFIDTPVKHYSSGMYVRLAFAVAAHLDPDILLVDEVLAVGDAAFQKKCLGKMSDIAKGGRTVLFVSHNMGAIATLCSRTLWLYQGRVQLDSETRHVISCYLNDEVKNAFEVRWDDKSLIPGNQSIKLESVSLLKDDKMPIETITMDSAFIIAVTCRLHKPFSSNVLGISIFSDQGHELFNSHNDDFKSACVSRWIPGVYTFYCKIPPFLLNEGDYYVRVASTQGLEICFIADQILHFTIHSVGRGSDYKCRGGFFRPILEWSHFCREVWQ